MRLDKQGRVRIPRELISIVGFDNLRDGEEIRLSMHEKYILLFKSSDKIASSMEYQFVIHIDSKGRMFIPSRCRKFYNLSDSSYLIASVLRNRIIIRFTLPK